MKKGLVLCCWIILFAVLSTEVFGAGFHIHEQGAKAMGMANAFVAQADDPSALFFNPAGIAYLEGTQISLGVTTIMVPETEFEGTTSLGGGAPLATNEKARKDVFFPPNFYLTHSMENQPISFGIGFNSIYPLAKRWKSTSNFRDEIKEISIKPFNVQPTVAYRIDKWNLAIAAGLDYTYAQVWLEKSPYSPLAPVNLGDLEIDGDGDGWGYNFGILWKPIKQVSIGLAYRSEIKLDIDGDADFLSSGAGPASFSGDASTEITLPDTWSLGIAYKPNERLTLEFDVDRFGWSSYDELDIDLTGSTLGDPAAVPKDWDDCWAFRFGAQYGVTENLDIRVGYAYDNTPQPEETVGPELPDADRHNYTFGIGYRVGKATFDLAYMFVDFKDRKVDNAIQSGTYKSEAHLFGANLTYKF